MKKLTTLLSKGFIAGSLLTFVACSKNQIETPKPLSTNATQARYNNAGLGWVRFTYKSTPNSTTVSFTNTSKPGNGYYFGSYRWDFGDGETSTAENPEHTYQAPGNYPVTLIIDIWNKSDKSYMGDFPSDPKTISFSSTPLSH